MPKLINKTKRDLQQIASIMDRNELFENVALNIKACIDELKNVKKEVEELYNSRKKFKEDIIIQLDETSAKILNSSEYLKFLFKRESLNKKK